MLHVKLIGMTWYLGEEGEGPEPERLLARAGRVCYASEKKGELEDFIRSRIRQKHFSLLEHCQLAFEISGISRVTSHQLVRHRIASYSQASQRFIDMSSADFVVPPSIQGSNPARAIFNEATRVALAAYEELRALGIKKEDCRFVLPNATKTTLVMSMNIRSIRNLVEVRLGGGSQWEIRELVEEILTVSRRAIPSAFEDLYTMYVMGKEF